MTLMGPGLYLKVGEKIGLQDAVIELSPNNNTSTSVAAINLRSGCSAIELCVLSLLIQKDYMDYKTELFYLDSFLDTKLDFSSCPKNVLFCHFLRKM